MNPDIDDVLARLSHVPNYSMRPIEREATNAEFFPVGDGTAG